MAKEIEDRLIGLAITEPNYTLPEAIAMGLRPEDFTTSIRRKLWKGLLDMWNDGVGIDPIVASEKLGESDVIDDLVQSLGTCTIDVPTYAALIIEDSIRSQQEDLGKKVLTLSQSDKETMDIMSLVRTTNNRLAERHARMTNPMIKNPADELNNTQGWSTDTGLPFLDRYLRLVSNRMHFLAGDPSSGKSTIIVHTLTHNAMQGINAVGILAEEDPLTVSLAMLTQRQLINTKFASRMQYDPTFRTTARIDKVRQLWDDNFSNLPLQIYSVSEGPDEVVSIINSLTKPSIIAIDHAVAVVAQAQMSKNIKEHQSFSRFFSQVHDAAERNNHVVIMANQYTKEGRAGESRGGDAEYGGSVVQNIATTQIHLYRPENEFTTTKGYTKMLGTIPKCRVLLVQDQWGQLVNPVNSTADIPFKYWINAEYRACVDELPKHQTEE